MWSFRAWRRRRILARHPISAEHWRALHQRLPILDGLTPDEQQRLHERAVLFLHHKRLTALPDWADPATATPAATYEAVLAGAGATRAGEYPFLSTMDLTTGATERVWTSEDGAYESVLGILDDNGRRLVTRRETRNDPPNLFVRDLDAQATALVDGKVAELVKAGKASAKPAAAATSPGAGLQGALAGRFRHPVQPTADHHQPTDFPVWQHPGQQGPVQRLYAVAA